MDNWELDFGYQRITVNRPLKLNFQASAERIANLKAQKAFARLKLPRQQAILAAFELLDANQLYKNRPAFLNALKSAFKETSVEVKSALFKTIWKALSQQDSTADSCCDKKGRPETERPKSLIQLGFTCPLVDLWQVSNVAFHTDKVG